MNLDVSGCSLTRRYLEIILRQSNIEKKTANVSQRKSRPSSSISEIRPILYHLELLNMGNNPIEDDGFMMLIGYITRNLKNTIRYLYLYNCGISDVSDVKVLNYFMDSAVMEVDLYGNKLDTNSTKEIQNAVIDKKKDFRIIYI